MNIDLSGSALSEKEQKILGAACRIFSEKGYSAATTSEIAKDAGVAEGTIFRYFKTKKHILHGLLLKLAEILADQVAIPPIEKILREGADKSAEEILRDIIIDRMQMVEQNFSLFKVILSEALYHDDILLALKDIVSERMYSLMTQYLTGMVKSGKLRSLPPQMILTSIIGNIFIFIFTRKIVFKEAYDEQQLAREIDLLIDIIIHGIGGTPQLSCADPC